MRGLLLWTNLYQLFNANVYFLSLSAQKFILEARMLELGNLVICFL